MLQMPLFGTPPAASCNPLPGSNRVEMVLLKGIDTVRDILIDNTQRFASGHSANNALLWGARGMGKSSLVKAAHATINQQQGSEKEPLKLIEIHREDIDSLPRITDPYPVPCPSALSCFATTCPLITMIPATRRSRRLWMEALKAVPKMRYFTLHLTADTLMPRDMIENERSTSISPSEAVEEKVSLSDRFGLWLGFHKCNQDDYLSMVDGYIQHFGLGTSVEDVRADALEWSTTRGKPLRSRGPGNLLSIWQEGLAKASVKPFFGLNRRPSFESNCV